MDKFAARWPLILALLAAVSMLGCGEDRIEVYDIYNSPVRVIHPQVAPFVGKLEDLSGREVQSSVILSDDLSAWVAGDCIRDLEKQQRGLRNVVRINRKWFDARATAEPFAVEWVTFHEIGHCDLWRAHFDDRTIGGEPESLMIRGHQNAYIWSEDFIANPDRYIDELFDDARFGDALVTGHAH